MTVMHEIEFAYAVGEEVLFRLDGAEVVGRPIDDAAWSIGEIAGRVASGGRPRYRVRFRHVDEGREAQVVEAAIEGVV